MSGGFFCNSIGGRERVITQVIFPHIYISFGFICNFQNIKGNCSDYLLICSCRTARVQGNSEKSWPDLLKQTSERKKKKKRNFPVKHLKIHLSYLFFVYFVASQVFLSTASFLFKPQRRGRERAHVHRTKSLTHCLWSGKYLRRGISGRFAPRWELLPPSHIVQMILVLQTDWSTHSASKGRCLQEWSPVVWRNCDREEGIWELKSWNYATRAQARITEISP